MQMRICMHIMYTTCACTTLTLTLNAYKKPNEVGCCTQALVPFGGLNAVVPLLAGDQSVC